MCLFVSTAWFAISRKNEFINLAWQRLVGALLPGEGLLYSMCHHLNVQLGERSSLFHLNSLSLSLSLSAKILLKTIYKKEKKHGTFPRKKKNRR